MDKQFEQQIVDKINALILPENLDHAKILLQENAGSIDSIVIRLENNPWRNGVIKGDIIFARIKANGDTQYLNFKNKFLHLFDGMNIKYLSVPDAEAQYDWARVELNSFMELLNAPTNDFIKAVNEIYLGSIVFPEFGCCSKYKECSERKECVHSDRLYSTACQYRKIINNIDKKVSVSVFNNEEDVYGERKYKGKSIIDFPESYVIIDLETTGLMPDFDEIIEIAALKIENGNITDTFQQLVKPENEIGSFIEQLTGITNEMLSAAPKINEVLLLVDKFVGDNIVIGHNVNFDVNFLYDNYMNVFERPFSNDFIDTMRIARKIYPKLPHHRLKDIVEHLGIEENGYHRALQDCKYTYKCYKSMQNSVMYDFGGIKEFQKLFTYGKIDLRKLTAENANFDETHPLYKKLCVFTGTLEKYTRQQAAQIVVDLGGTCGNTVTKKTDYLILGNNDYCSTIKNGKSSKQQKAEEYKLKGQDIEIIPESVFYDMISEN